MVSHDASARAATLSEALPYIQSFRDQTFVIKYGGSAMEDEDVVERLLRDVVFLEAVGINPVLVHGGGKAINARLREAGHVSRFVGGLRVTDEAAMGIVEEVLDREVNPRLVRLLEGFGARTEASEEAMVIRSSSARRIFPSDPWCKPCRQISLGGGR